MTKMFPEAIKLKFFIEVGLMMEHGRRDRGMMGLPQGLSQLKNATLQEDKWTKIGPKCQHFPSKTCFSGSHLSRRADQ